MDPKAVGFTHTALTCDIVGRHANHSGRSLLRPRYDYLLVR